MRTPRKLGSFNQLLEDIGRSDREIARHLGTTIPSVRKYREKDSAPRAVMIALFYETQWGRSLLHIDAVNGEMYARAYASSLERQVQVLREQIAVLERELEIAKVCSSAANLPIFRTS